MVIQFKKQLNELLDIEFLRTGNKFSKTGCISNKPSGVYE